MLNGDLKSSVLAATDIVELIGQSVALKKRGRDYVGLCPFHQEKTPSFHVSPGKQYFHCYGCKAGGNAIDFVMKRDRIEFIDGLKALAERAGIEVPRFGGKQQGSERQGLLEAQSAACSMFQSLLAADSATAKAARDYLAQRGFNAETLQRFSVGFAPAGWDTALTHPTMKKFAPGLLAQAGLLKPRDNGGHYDTFRNRVMFPIRDESGRVIAFGGRVMPGSEDPAKYLNSPETPLFSKSRCVYGIDLARQRIAETRTAVVVEGYTDVLMAHQCGVSNVVSVLGTALTEQHVRVLQRFADRIVLLFDADTAGTAAADKAVALFLTQPIEIAIASLPAEVDPDEFLLQQGAEGFAALIATATPALDYKWKQLQSRIAGADDVTGQQKAVTEYLDLLAGARGSGPVDAVRWGVVLSRVSRLTEIPMEALNRRFGRKSKKSSGNNPEQNRPNAPSAPLTAREQAERQILGVLLAEPGRWAGVQHRVNPQDFAQESNAALAEAYWNHQRDEGEPVFSEFLSVLAEQNLSELAVELVDAAETLADSALLLEGAVNYLSEMRSRGEERQLMATIRQPAGADAQDEVELFRKLQEKRCVPDLRRVL